MICPVCLINKNKKVEMIKMEGLPVYLDIRPFAKQHPIPIVRGFAEKTLNKIFDDIKGKIFYYKCPKCGYVQIHESVDEG